MTAISEKQRQAVLALPGPERYRHFIKRVVDGEEAWGLYSDGWATSETDDGTAVLVLWPARDYAQLSASGAWEGYEPTSISLEDLVDEVLPDLREKNILPGVFPTPTDHGVTPGHEQRLEDLREEMEKYPA